MNQSRGAIFPLIYLHAMRILDAKQIKRKIARIAIEILERHVEHGKVVLVGINNNGYATAKLLKKSIEKEGYELEVVLRQVQLAPANPLHGGITYKGNVEELDGQHVIIVDDVANTGRTAYYASKPIMEVVPASLEVAVLVDRSHKSFPVSSDYIGLALATTLQEDIRVYYDKDWRVEIY